MTTADDLHHTPLHALHEELGAKFVPFAGYAMPVQYRLGVLGEHLHTRAKAGLFDVSHMGQIRLDGARVGLALETLVPGDIQGLSPGRMRYTLLTNETGGIRDDLMVTRQPDHLFLVVNGATKAADIAHLQTRLQGIAEATPLPDRALLALQGPAAATVLSKLNPAVAGMAFLSGAPLVLAGIACFVTRSGYTGEDGYEISLPAENAETLARRLLADPDVAPIGLGARDSLRLEAGLCLYGHDIDETTTPIEADLAWTIGKRRRAEGGFPGAEIILRQLAEGAKRRRVGIRLEGRAPAREGSGIDAGGVPVGTVTSGGFAPSVNGPIAMGYVDRDHAAIGTPLSLIVRAKPLAARVAPLPFMPHRYRR